jgi:hypothetical protein
MKVYVTFELDGNESSILRVNKSLVKAEEHVINHCKLLEKEYEEFYGNVYDKANLIPRAEVFRSKDEVTYQVSGGSVEVEFTIQSFELEE